MNTGKLKEIYYDRENPAYLAGITSLYREAKKHNIPYRDVVNFLKEQEVYTKFKRAPNRYPKHIPVTAIGLGTNLQIDLMFYPQLKWQNFRYIGALVAIDVFSGLTRARPIKSKKSKEVLQALTEIIDSFDTTTHIIGMDGGLEFAGSVKTFLEKNNIRIGILQMPRKASNCESVIGRIRKGLEREMAYSKTTRWVDHLEAVVNRINSSYLKRIGMAPKDVTLENEDIVRKRIEKHNNSRKPARPPLYRKGNNVRIKIFKKIFEKGSKSRFSDEIYEITDVLSLYNPVAYKVKLKSTGQEVRGKFTEYELAPAGTKNG